MKTIPTVAIGFTTPPNIDEAHNLALISATGLARLNHKVLYLDLSAAKKSNSSPMCNRSGLSLRDFLDGKNDLSELIFESPLGIHVISTNFCKKSLLRASPLELTNLVESFETLNKDFDFLILNFPDKSTASSIALLEACHIQIMSIEPTSKSIAKAYKLLQHLKNTNDAEDVYLLPTSVPSLSYGWKLFQRFNQAVIGALNIQTKYLASMKSLPDMNFLQTKRSLPPTLMDPLTFPPLLELVQKIESLKSNASQAAHKFFEFKNFYRHAETNFN